MMALLCPENDCVSLPQETKMMTEEKAERGGRREPGVPQLMQELQLNVLQQTHLMQAGEKVRTLKYFQ